MTVPDAVPDLTGHFGRYGGRFVPEALVVAIDDLTAAFHETQADPEFRAELARLHRDYTGRPSPLTEAPKFGEHAGGARILLKREDLNHTGSHKINNVLGQALLTRHIGKKRVIAETGAGQHGVATATAAALLDLDCTVYMGEEDTRRQALNVTRMRLLGAEVVPVTTGSRTLKDAINEAMRDWVTNVDTTNYVFGTVAGPHPFPMMVREYQRIIGDEARAQVLERVGRLPDVVAACVGGGSNAIGIFTAFVPDAGGAAGRVRGRRRRRRDGPARGVHHRRCARRAARRALLPAAGRERADRRVALDLGRARLSRASARSTRTCTTSAAPSTARSPTPRRWTRSRCSRAPRGSSRRSSPRTRWPARSTSAANSGRTRHPGEPVRPRRQGRRDRGRVLRAVSHDGAVRRAGQGQGGRPRRAHRLPARRLPGRGRVDRRDARAGRRRLRRRSRSASRTATR